ncbi:histidine kinase [uncultured Acetobacteroides sp.]|uniref:sensor histidine kinase n=1 Tax=uncultured Acetobacteroides sp. TaxID=1760811 RepID=UPI0029F59A8A|nr:histidine kinase [uncultured Acetobacteroides sp.]
MNNNTLTKKILIFLLLALMVCLFANINQIVGMYIADPHPRPHPPRFPGEPRFREDMFRYRMVWEMVLSFVSAFTIIAYNAGVFRSNKRTKKSNQLTVVAISTLAGLLLFVFLIVVFLPNKHFPSRFISLILSKALFVIMASISAGQLYRLIWQKQQVEIENEKLKTDSLQSRYQGLMNQLNPHFLFNSLNSLSYLIRENEQNKALTFIDELSSIFRYVLQKRSEELVTLEEEIQFTEAYRYLLSIRFENKLFFEIKIDESDMKLLLPFLTLQPLIENAVKHNVISTKQPLAVFIYTEEDNLVVSNPISAKLPDGESTGIGLSNLASRFKLLTGKQLTVINDEKTFLVKIPLVSKQ